MTFDAQRLVADLVAGHELGYQERAKHVVLRLSGEANLSSGTLGGVSHLGLGVIARVTEQVTLRQHACGDSGAGVAQLRDVRLPSKAIDRKIGVGVTAGLAVDLSDGVFKYHLLILFTHNSVILIVNNGVNYLNRPCQFGRQTNLSCSM